MKKTTACTWLYLLFLTVILAVFGVFIKQGNWLQTDLTALLPKEQRWQPVQQWADSQQELALNKQVIVMIGNQDANKARTQVAEIAEQWRQSGLFEQVTSAVQPDIAKLQQEIKQLRLAVLPQAVLQQLKQDPASYFQQYAEQIVNPFAQTNLLPLEQDWLGFGRFVLSQSQQQTAVQWDVQSGSLYVNDGKTTWVLLRGELAQGSFINPSLKLSELLNANRLQVEAQGSQMLATGAALFAAQAKQSAEQESQLMSVLGIGLTLLLLLVVFRSLRVLWLFMPIAVGMLVGVVATVSLFGHIHILTLVIGTSLIGVLIDFPLHWLSSSLFVANWQGEQAMKKLRLTFFITLLITLLGYGLLAFTALPVLKQTALFSAASLIAAMATTLLLLPKCFRCYQPKNIQLTHLNWQIRSFPKSLKWAFSLILATAVGLGLWKSQWQDDIRQWVSMPKAMLNEAQQIGQLTGINLGSQYFLLQGENEQDLLAKNQALSAELQARQIGFQSLSQWLLSPEQQTELKQALQQLKPQDYGILAEIGVPLEQVQTSIQALSQSPTVSLNEALNTELGQGFRSLYLGEYQGKPVSLIKVQQAASKISQELTALAEQKGVFWQDKRANLNQSFQTTRDQAAWLKLASFVLAGLLLVRYFGRAKTAKMLVIPFAAIVFTVAIFGWLGLPISLFTMFGLLLVSAIGIDYTAYMQTAQEPLPHKRVAVSLAAATTLISFLLLGLSSTPAVASFGLSVSLGVALSVLLTFKFIR